MQVEELETIWLRIDQYEALRLGGMLVMEWDYPDLSTCQSSLGVLSIALEPSHIEQQPADRGHCQSSLWIPSPLAAQAMASTLCCHLCGTVACGARPRGGVVAK